MRERTDLPPAPSEGEPTAPIASSICLAQVAEVITADEVAALLRLDRKTVYAAVREGSIPGVRKIGRVIRFHRRTVLEWLAGERRVLRSDGRPK